MPRYALVNRPAGFATVPTGLLYEVLPRPSPGQPHHEMARHGILVASRELTQNELLSYEIAPLIEDDAIDPVVAAVVEQLVEHREAHLEIDADEPDYLRQVVHQAAGRHFGKPAPSITDPEGLVDRVRRRLQSMSPACS